MPEKHENLYSEVDMANKKLKCENCGFEEELTAAQIEEREASGSLNKCSQCGAEFATEEPSAKTKKGAAKDKTNAKSKAEPDAAAEAPSDATVETQPEEEKSDARAKAEAAKESAMQAAGVAKAQMKKAFEAGRKDPVFISNLIDSGMKKLTALIKPETFDANASRAITFGHYALLLLSVASLIMGIVLGIRLGTAAVVLSGVVVAVFLLLAQYVAVKSFRLFEGVIDNHPTKLSGPGIVEIFAIINMIAAVVGIVVLVGGIVDLDASVVAYGLLVAVLAFLIAVVLTQADKHLNVQYDKKTSLGENLLGLLAINIKSSVKLVPYIFGIGLAVSTVLCIFPFVTLLVKGDAAIYSAQGLSNLLGTAAFFAFSPAIIYLTVITTYLLIDLLRSILSLGKK